MHMLMYILTHTCTHKNTQMKVHKTSPRENTCGVLATRHSRTLCFCCFQRTRRKSKQTVLPTSSVLHGGSEGKGSTWLLILTPQTEDKEQTHFWKEQPGGTKSAFTLQLGWCYGWVCEMRRSPSEHICLTALQIGTGNLHLSLCGFIHYEFLGKLFCL